MAQEMHKAGIIEEMVDDAMAMTEVIHNHEAKITRSHNYTLIIQGDDVEEAADEEVEKIVAELTLGKFDAVSSVPSKVAGSPTAVGSPAEAEVEDVGGLESRLQAL